MSNYNQVKDSGERRNFDTGSVRDKRTGKGRFDLMSPIVELRDAKHLENGAAKYGDRNWELGQNLSSYIDSAKRHISKYMEGHRDEDHLAAARWNLGALIHTEEMVKRGILPASLNDLPQYLRKAPEAAPEAAKGEQEQPKYRYFREGEYWWRVHVPTGYIESKREGGEWGKSVCRLRDLDDLREVSYPEPAGEPETTEAAPEKPKYRYFKPPKGFNFLWRVDEKENKVWARWPNGDWQPDGNSVADIVEGEFEEVTNSAQ